MIKKLPKKADVRLTDEAAILAADAAYTALASGPKGVVDAEVVVAIPKTTANTWLNDAKAQLTALIAALTDAEKIDRANNFANALPAVQADVTRDHEASVTAAMEAYNALKGSGGEEIQPTGIPNGGANDNQKLVKEKARIIAALKQITALKAEDTKKVEALAKEYPTSAMTVNSSSTLKAAEEAVAKAKAAYNAASAWVKKAFNAKKDTEPKLIKTTKKNNKPNKEGFTNTN